MKATLIYNPVSGKKSKRKKIQAVREALEKVGIPHHFRETLQARDGTRLAREALIQGSDLVIAAGGDGTTNEVVNGLVGTGATLALIPLGTGNLAAHEFGVPLDPIEAALALPKGKRQRIDVGKANDRYFLMMTSLGLDAKALRDAPKWAYRLFRWWAFYVTGFLSLFTLKPFPIHLEMNGEVLDLKTRLMVISNIKGYGLPGCEFLSSCSVTDGLLDLGFFRSQSIASYLTGIRRLGETSPMNEQLLHHHRLKTARITTQTPVPVQVDGDFYGYTPLEVAVIPNSLSILSFPSDKKV